MLVRADMARIVLSVVILITSSSSSPHPQLTRDSGNARILQEQRFNTGGGRFGSAYSTVGGVRYGGWVAVWWVVCSMVGGGEDDDDQYCRMMAQCSGRNHQAGTTD